MKYAVVYFLLVISVSCSNQSKKNESDYALRQYLKTVAPYGAFVNTPEDTLLLGFSKGTANEDTSWTLFIIKSQESIHCRYNQILPYNVTGFDDYLDDSTKLLYYEGFSFQIKKQRWNNLINLSGLSEYIVKDSVRYSGCLHCPRYTAYYKSKLVVNSKTDNEYLIKLDSLLHKELINDLFEKKLNPPIQLQK